MLNDLINCNTYMNNVLQTFIRIFKRHSQINNLCFIGLTIIPTEVRCKLTMLK